MSNEIAEFQTEHNLPFEVARWDYDPTHWQRFRVGTCEGVWGVTDKSYGILAISNDNPGNGHLNDVFEWFEHSCKRDGKTLKILETWNAGFKSHLINKRGFIDIGGDNLEKTFELNTTPL